MADAHDEHEERIRGIDRTLEGLRRNTEDLHELVEQACERARRTVDHSKAIAEALRERRERRRRD